jgi:hypothetical protein
LIDRLAAIASITSIRLPPVQEVRLK